MTIDEKKIAGDNILLKYRTLWQTNYATNTISYKEKTFDLGVLSSKEKFLLLAESGYINNGTVISYESTPGLIVANDSIYMIINIMAIAAIIKNHPSIELIGFINPTPDFNNGTIRPKEQLFIEVLTLKEFFDKIVFIDNDYFNTGLCLFKIDEILYDKEGNEQQKV